MSPFYVNERSHVPVELIVLRRSVQNFHHALLEDQCNSISEIKAAHHGDAGSKKTSNKKTQRSTNLPITGVR